MAAAFKPAPIGMGTHKKPADAWRTQGGSRAPPRLPWKKRDGEEEYVTSTARNIIITMREGAAFGHPYGMGLKAAATPP